MTPTPDNASHGPGRSDREHPLAAERRSGPDNASHGPGRSDPSPPAAQGIPDGHNTGTSPDNADATGAAAERTRRLFSYLGGTEWQEYRVILQVFADTFFTEFTPDDVATRTGIDADTVRDRLESLKRWGNLTVSSSVGNPSSIDDYYRRRHRYLITSSGQEVFDLVERVLAAADEIGDVQAGRLRDLLRALESVSERAVTGSEPAASRSGGLADADLADAVRTVFDHHDSFTAELTQFFAQLNEWQNRYNLTAKEVQVFASVLVDYVSEQLTEIERMAAPIGRVLERLLARLDDLLPVLRSGLAARVEEAGLGDSVTVRRIKGTEAQHWQHLAAWFVPASGRPSRLDQLTRQALAAVRTLTINVNRLARQGAGMSSRRSDFVRLAGFLDRAPTLEQAQDIVSAAFGLGSCRRLGTLSSDIDDPGPITTPWSDAARAAVPVALRERGENSVRGQASPMRDRSREIRDLKRRRELERTARERTAAELLACADSTGRIDGASLSSECFAMLRDLIGRSSHGVAPGTRVRRADEAGVRCEVRPAQGARTQVQSPEGRLTMNHLVVTVVPDNTPPATSPAHSAPPSPADP